MSMTVNTRREIMKSLAYGMTTNEICKVYHIKKETVSRIQKESKNEISEIKKHYKQMGGM